jgi:hypothetical protein
LNSARGAVGARGSISRRMETVPPASGGTEEGNRMNSTVYVANFFVTFVAVICAEIVIKLLAG